MPQAVLPEPHLAYASHLLTRLARVHVIIRPNFEGGHAHTLGTVLFNSSHQHFPERAVTAVLATSHSSIRFANEMIVRLPRAARIAWFAISTRLQLGLKRS